MSYVCLAVSNHGAAASGDSRITIESPISSFHIHHDHGKKVFSSVHGKTIWAFTGITYWAIWYYPAIVRLHLRDDSRPLEDRLNTVRRVMKFFTRPPFPARIPWIRNLPLVKNSWWSKGFAFHLLYAEGNSCGKISFCHGRISTDRMSAAPAIIESGRNQYRLTPLVRYKPDAEASPEELCLLTYRRTAESIEMDKELQMRDRTYCRTIGGRIRTEMSRK